MGSTRLDMALVERGLAPTRARARDAILRGHVTVGGRLAAKPAQTVEDGAEIAIDDPAAAYVSRAALKLIAGLDRFGFSPNGRVALDLGASTGGFTQVLLERGARKVFAVDVGHGQLDPVLGADPRVVSREGLNARDLTTADVGEPVGAIVADVSFISLRLVLPPALKLAAPGAWGVFLVKPQFEAGRDAIGKGGIVRDAQLGERTAADLAAWLEAEMGWRTAGVILSPIEGGDGNPEAGGMRVFVPYTLPGETVEIEREGERGRLVRVIEASPDRVAPVCANFAACGVCALEHMARPAYLAWKREQVAAAFAQRGIDAAVEPMVAIAAASRRRAVFSAVRTAKGIVFGFHARGSEAIVDIGECAVLVPGIVAKLPELKAIAAIALSRWKPARVTVFLADNGLDIAFTGAGKPDRTMLEKLGAFGNDMAIARLTVDGVEVFRSRQPEFMAGPATLLPVPGGFTQAAKASEAALAAVVIAHVGDVGPVADLFAGIGTFTFRLAARAPVTAVEGEAALVAAIEAAARRANHLKKVTARRRDLFGNPLAPVELDAFAAVVFDPPAAGAKAQAEMLAKSKVAKVVAVSCNPATLARDARILIDGGYRLERVVPVDQFLFSAEIEAVATFIR